MGPKLMGRLSSMCRKLANPKIRGGVAMGRDTYRWDPLLIGKGMGGVSLSSRACTFFNWTHQQTFLSPLPALLIAIGPPVICAASRCGVERALVDSLHC
jgi:hypothetical protein